MVVSTGSVGWRIRSFRVRPLACARRRRASRCGLSATPFSRSAPWRIAWAIVVIVVAFMGGLARRPEVSGGSRQRFVDASFLRGQPCGLVFGGQGVDEVVEVALHHAVDFVQRQVNPVVGHPALGEIVGPDAFAAVPRAHLRLPVGGSSRSQG